MFSLFALVTNNQKEPEGTKGKNEKKLVFNTIATIKTNQTRTEEFEGREYLIAPVVAVIPKVLNGELLTYEALAYSKAGWEGRPLTVNHPKDQEGYDVSANRLDILPKYYIGRFHNVNFNYESEELSGEVWIDVEKCQELGGEALQLYEKVRDGEPVEVSTGYFRILEYAEGVYKGQSYYGKQKNILPDHLAILPNKVGACSLEDGCGINTNEGEDQEGSTLKIDGSNFLDKLTATFNSFIEKIKGGNSSMNEEKRKKIISRIINCKDSGFATNSQELLEGMGDEQLLTIARGINCNGEGTQNNNNQDPAPQNQQEPQEPANNNNNQIIVPNSASGNEVLSQVLEQLNNLSNTVTNMSSKVDSLEEGVKVNENKQKEQYIQVITNSEQFSDFTEEELTGLDNKMLEKMAKNCSAYYGGLGGPINLSSLTDNSEEEIEEPIPVLLASNDEGDQE